MWRAITDDDIFTSEYESAVLRAAMLTPGQEDPHLVAARQVTGIFRSAIRSGPDNRLPVDEALLPEVAIYHAAAVVRFRLITRFASETLMNDDRRREQRDAMDWMKMVRSGDEKIEQPDLPENDTGKNSPTIEVAGKVDRVWNRRQQSGL